MNIKKTIKKQFEKEFKCKLTDDETDELIKFVKSSKNREQINEKVKEILERKGDE